MVVSDMTVPGIPLVYINKGFQTVTGHGKEKIGTSCRFLQGPETEKYLIEEICEALRHAEPLVVKLHNYRANGEKFQCLLHLHPVFGPDGDYKYQIGLQMEFSMNAEITRQLLEMERVSRYLPFSMTGTDPRDMKRVIPTDIMGDQNLHPFVKVDVSAVAPQAVAASSAKAVEVMAAGKEVSTKKGKGKDQYGRKFGKKQKSAMLEFSKSLWMQDSLTSLRNLLTLEPAQRIMLEFLKTEYGEAQLEFYLDAMRLEAMQGHPQQGQMAMQVYASLVGSQGKGIGQQERTAATQQLWDRANSSGAGNVDPNTAMQKIREEAENILKMLSFDAFPRFLKSKFCEQLVQIMQQGGGVGQQAVAMLNNISNVNPTDADDWLNTFVSSAESFPACIVISVRVMLV